MMIVVISRKYSVLAQNLERTFDLGSDPVVTVHCALKIAPTGALILS